MDIVMFLSYLAVYFLGIVTVLACLAVSIWRFEQNRTKSNREAAGRLKEHLDHMPTPGPILIDKD